MMKDLFMILMHVQVLGLLCRFKFGWGSWVFYPKSREFHAPPGAREIVNRRRLAGDSQLSHSSTKIATKTKK
jgi:hypothetical protein